MWLAKVRACPPRPARTLRTRPARPGAPPGTLSGASSGLGPPRPPCLEPQAYRRRARRPPLADTLARARRMAGEEKNGMPDPEPSPDELTVDPPLVLGRGSTRSASAAASARGGKQLALMEQMKAKRKKKEADVEEADEEDTADSGELVGLGDHVKILRDANKRYMHCIGKVGVVVDKGV